MLGCMAFRGQGFGLGVFTLPQGLEEDAATYAGLPIPGKFVPKLVCICLKPTIWHLELDPKAPNPKT